MKNNDQDDWNVISEVGLPAKGSYYDCYTFDKNGRIVEKLYLEYNPFAVDWAYQKGGPVWQYDVTHWRAISTSADVPQPQEPITHSIFVDAESYAFVVEFNEYCAKVRGIKTFQDQYCDLDYAVRNAVTFNAYRAWNDVNEMAEVMKTLLSPSDLKSLKLSIEVNGKESVYRTCIHNLMNGVGPHMNFEEEKADEKADEKDYQTWYDFNVYCAKVLGIEIYQEFIEEVGPQSTLWRADNDGAWFPWDNEGEMEDVMRTLLTQRDMDCLNLARWKNGKKNVYRACIQEMLRGVKPVNGRWPEEKCEEPLEDAKIALTDNKHEFNELCYGILAMEVDVLSETAKWSPFDNLSQLSLIMDIVLEKSGGTFVCNGETDLTFTEEQRQYIRKYGTDRYLRSEEWKFNRLCAELIKASNIDYNVGEDFDPYNNMNDLAVVMPVVILRADEPFGIPATMSILPAPDCYNNNIQDNMRFYVQRFGQDVLDMLQR